MAELKTRATKASVSKFIQALSNTQRRADAKVVVKMMESIAGEKPAMWGPRILERIIKKSWARRKSEPAAS